MNPLMFRDPDYFAKPIFAGVVAALAGLTTSAVTDTGIAVDKRAASTGKQFQGVQLALPVQVLLDSGQSQAVALTLQHSDASSSGYATLATETTTLTNSTTDTGVTTRALAKVSANVLSAKRWVRGRVVFTGSDADTGGNQDASALVMTFMGANEEPV